MVELIYTLFLLSGLAKAFLNFYAGSLMVIDFTLLCALILAVVYILHFSRNFFFRSSFYIFGPSRTIIFTILVFYMWMIITLLYTHSPGYCYIKIFMFLTVLVALVFPFIYRGFNPTRFFHLFSYLGSGLIFIYSALLPNLYADYLRLNESREMLIKYLDIGYLAGIIILIVTFACPRMKPLLKILLIGINGWTLLVSAARGPTVFLSFVLMIRFIVGFVTFMKKSWKLNLKNVFYMTCAVGILGTAVYYLMDKYAFLLERSISRMLLLLDPQSGSIGERFSQIYFSFNKIFENAANFSFGLGIGSFGMLYDHVDQRNYPHNVILEIWFELGIVGVILFTLVVFIYFKKIRLHFNFVLIFTFLFLNSLKSYSMVDSRMMFGILSVLLIYNTLLKRKRDASPTPEPENFDELKK